MSSPGNPVNTIAAPPIDPPSPDAAAATTSSSAGTSGDVSTAKASQPASPPPSPASRSPLSSSPATTGGVAHGDSTETRTEQQPDGEDDADITAAAPHTHASHAPASAPASQPVSLPAPPRPMPFGKRVVRCCGDDLESSVDAASGPLSGPQTPQGSTSAVLVAGGLTQPTAGAPVMVAGVPSLSGFAAAAAQQGRGPATTTAAGQATGVLKSLPVFPPRVFRSVGTASSPPAPSSTGSLAAAAPRFVTPPTPARLSIPMPAMRHMSTPLSSPTIGPSTTAAVLHMATSPLTLSGVVTMGGLGGGTPSSVFARGGSRRRNSISVPTSPFNEDGDGDGNESAFADDVAGGDGYGGGHQPPQQQQRGAGGRGTEPSLVDSQRRGDAAAAVPFVAVKSEPASRSGSALSPTSQTARSSATAAAAAAAATAASNAVSVATAPEQSSSSTSVSHQTHVQTPHAPPPPPPPAPPANTNVNGTAVQRTGSANAARAGTLSASTDRLRTSLVIGPLPSPLVSPDAGSVVCGAPGGSLPSAHRGGGGGGGGVTGTSMSRRDSPSSSLRFAAHDPYNMSAIVATPLTANVHRTTSLTSYRSPSAAATPTGAGFMHLRTWSPSTLLTMHGVGGASGAAPASSTGADRPANPGESGTSFSYYANANSDSISIRSSAVDASRGAHEGMGLWAYGATPSRLPSPSTADQFLYDSQPPFEDYAAPHTARYAGDATPRQAGAAHAAALAPADSADDSCSEADELAYEAEEAPMQTQAQPQQHEHSSSDDAAFERTHREEHGGGHAEQPQQQPRTPRIELPACLPHDDAPQEGTDEYAGGYVPPAMPRYAAPRPNARPPPPPRSRSGEPAITAAAAYWPPYGSTDYAYAPPAQRNGYAPTPTSSYQQPQQQRYPDPRGAAASAAGFYPPPVANAAPPYPDPSQGSPRPHQAYPAQRGRGGSAVAVAGAAQQRKRTAQHALPGFFSIDQVELGDQTHLTADRHGVLHDHHEEASQTPNSQSQAHGEEAGVRSGSAAGGYTPLPSPPHHSARPYDRHGGDTAPVPPASPSSAVYYDVAASGGAARGGAGAVGGSRAGAESAATVTGRSSSLYGSDDDELARLQGGGSGMGSGGYALASMRPMARGALAGGGAGAQLSWLSGPRGGYAGGGAPRSGSAGATHQAILFHANLGSALVNEMTNGRGNGGVGETAAPASGPASHNIDGFANVSSSTLSGPLPPPMPHLHQQQQPAPGMNGGYAANNAFLMRSSALYGAVPAPPPHEYPQQQQQHLHASPPLSGPVQTRISSCSYAAHDAQSDFRGSSTSSAAPFSPPLPRSAAAHQRLVPSNAPISDMRPLPNSVKQSPAATYNAMNSNTTSSSSGGDAAKDAYATQAGVGCSSSDINPPSQRQVTMATLKHLHAGGSGGEGSRSVGTAPYPQQQQQQQQHLQQPSNLSHAYHSQPHQQQQQCAARQLTYRLSGRGRGGGGAMLAATGHCPYPSDGSLVDSYDGAEAGAIAASPVMMQRHRGVR